MQNIDATRNLGDYRIRTMVGMLRPFVESAAVVLAKVSTFHSIKTA
jgi:hypothetical protein